MTATRPLAAFAAFAALVAGGCGGPDVPPPARTGASQVARPPQTFGSEFEVRIDRPAMVAAGVDQAAVAEALSAFFKSRPTFTLTELNALRVRGTGGREVPLRQIATVDVRFGPARTEVLIGDEGK